MTKKEINGKTNVKSSRGGENIGFSFDFTYTIPTFQPYHNRL